MSLAIIIHEEAFGTDGGAVGAALNTWYRREITSAPINEGSIIRSITTSAGNYAFELDDGTYRIEAEMSFYISYTFSASGDTASAIGALYNDTDAALVLPFCPSYMSNSASSLAGTGTAGATIPVGRMVTLHCNGIFTVTGGPKTYSFRAAGSGTETWVANTNACGISHGVSAVIGGSPSPNRYLTAKIILKT